MKKESKIIKHFIDKKHSLKKEHKKHENKEHKVHKEHKDHRDRSLNRKASSSKKTWEKFLNNPSSKNLIKKSWSSKNPQKEYSKVIKKLADEFKNK